MILITAIYQPPAKFANNNLKGKGYGNDLKRVRNVMFIYVGSPFILIVNNMMDERKKPYNYL